MQTRQLARLSRTFEILNGAIRVDSYCSFGFKQSVTTDFAFQTRKKQEKKPTTLGRWQYIFPPSGRHCVLGDIDGDENQRKRERDKEIKR